MALLRNPQRFWPAVWTAVVACLALVLAARLVVEERVQLGAVVGHVARQHQFVARGGHATLARGDGQLQGDGLAGVRGVELAAGMRAQGRGFGRVSVGHSLCHIVNPVCPSGRGSFLSDFRAQGQGPMRTAYH